MDYRILRFLDSNPLFQLVACVGGCDPNITGYLAMANKNFNSFYEKDPATVIPPYFQQGMRPTPEPKRASATAKRSYPYSIPFC